MATKKKKKNSNGPIVALILVGIVGLASLAAYVKYGGASTVPPDERRPATNISHVGDKKDGKVTVITPTREGTDLKLHKKETDVPAGKDPILFAVNHYLQESKIVPDDARAVGVQVKDGVALLDMSPSFNQSYGSFDEEALLKGICASLAQFKNVDKVQFFVEGKTIETLGNVDLTQPIPVRGGSDAQGEPGAN